MDMTHPNLPEVPGGWTRHHNPELSATTIQKEIDDIKTMAVLVDELDSDGMLQISLYLRDDEATGEEMQTYLSQSQAKQLIQTLQEAIAHAERIPPEE